MVNILDVLSLPAATKLGQGNIFRSVCQEFCPQGGGVGLVPGGSPIFWGGRPIFRGGWFPVQFFGGLQFFWGVSKFSNFPDTVNERPVRILLECILVVVCLLISPNDSSEYKFYAMVKKIRVKNMSSWKKKFPSFLTRNFFPLKFRNPVFLGDKKKGQREIHLVPNFCACLSIMILSHV